MLCCSDRVAGQFADVWNTLTVAKSVQSHIQNRQLIAIAPCQSRSHGLAQFLPLVRYDQCAANNALLWVSRRGLMVLGRQLAA